ncbi:hypothetical protein Taro_049255 [Colocasia esculenta]|uniref:Uncharacterized protein n=1 Tax=Colocasia esculenta TaxID=4460 RepID=A0A843XAB9_COLES|nr:hypothetical protein [Colocasia esculenta]
MAAALLLPLHNVQSPLCSRRLPDPRRRHPAPPSSSSSLALRFRSSPHHIHRHLRTLGFQVSSSTPAEKLAYILSTLDYLRSRGFPEAQFPRLAFLCPGIFSSPDAVPALDLLFAFLTGEVAASPEQACGLIARCPALLTASVDFRLRPTLLLLRELGVTDLSSPTALNAHLLNTPAEKLAFKVKFLQGLGFSYQEAAQVCARLPAIFGYSVENNLRPKVEYLVNQMGRSIEEIKAFPQYFAFSLEKRIVPRHLHLMERNLTIPLQKMLLWGDERFYAKWK